MSPTPVGKTQQTEHKLRFFTKPPQTNISQYKKTTRIVKLETIDMRITTETSTAYRSAPHPRSARLRDMALHLQAEWRDCRHAVNDLRHADTFKKLCLRVCDELQLSVQGHAFFQFEPAGVTGTILLRDSHIAIHTWPESNIVKANIHIPGGNENTSGDALRLLETLRPHFQPAHSKIGPSSPAKTR